MLSLRFVGVLLMFLVSSAAVRADKDRAKGHYKRGMSAFVLNQFDEAIASFEAGFREEPEPAFLFNIAQAHGRAGRNERAIEFYRKYLELSGDRATDRSQVEQRIAELERVLAKSLERPTAPPSVAAPRPEIIAPPPRPPAKKRMPGWGWALVAVGAIVVVGGVVGGAIAATTPVNAPSRGGTEPTTDVRF